MGLPHTSFQLPRPWPWGKVVQVHEIGPYAIVEYRSKGEAPTCFAVFVDGQDLHRSSTTLEGALVLGIAYHQLLPTRAPYEELARAAAKLLDIPKD